MTPVDVLMVFFLGSALLFMGLVSVVLLIFYGLFGSPESNREKLREFVRSCR